MSLCSTAQPLHTRFPIIFGTCFSKVTIGYYPTQEAPARGVRTGGGGPNVAGGAGGRCGRSAMFALDHATAAPPSRRRVAEGGGGGGGGGGEGGGGGGGHCAMTSASTAPVQYMIATSLESVTLFLQNMSPAHAKMAAAAGIGASLFVWCAGRAGSAPAKKKCKKKVGSTKGGPNGNRGQKSATVAKTKGRKKTPPSREKSPSATQAALKRRRFL